MSHTAATDGVGVLEDAEVSDVCNVRLRFESQVLTRTFKFASRLRIESREGGDSKVAGIPYVKFAPFPGRLTKLPCCPSRGSGPREGGDCTAEVSHHRLDLPLPFPFEPLGLPLRDDGTPRSGAVQVLGFVQTFGGCKQREH